MRPSCACPASGASTRGSAQAAPIDKPPVENRRIAVPADVDEVGVQSVRPPDAVGTLPVVGQSPSGTGQPARGSLLELIRRMPEGEGAGPGAPETIEPTQGRPGAGGHGPTGPGGPAMKLFGCEPAPRPTSRAGVSEAPVAGAANLSMALTVLEWGAVGIARATHGRATAR